MVRARVPVGLSQRVRAWASATGGAQRGFSPGALGRYVAKFARESGRVSAAACRSARGEQTIAAAFLTEARAQSDRVFTAAHALVGSPVQEAGLAVLDQLTPDILRRPT